MRRWLLSLLLAAPAPAQAQQAVTSPRPERVALTVYRAPWGRGALDLRYLSGFALVTETRRVRLPRGPAIVRFEGVADGIIPVSAVIDGLPGGTIEKNRDARLLSPASLVDGTLGRQVTLTRTDRATGRAVSEQATIVAGPAQGVVLRTSAGIEALRCSGLPESLRYPHVPQDLSAKPVLSVATNTASARTVTVRLSYLSSGFDWRASYVASVAPNARTLDLFAWLTLGNANPEGFRQAEVQAVAGRLNREAIGTIARDVGALRLACFPLGTTTSDLRERKFEPQSVILTASRMYSPLRMAAPAPPSPPAPPPPPPPEDLGDLKLYRVPERADVAGRSQKQIALLSAGKIPFERRYRLSIIAGRQLDVTPTSIVLVVTNKKAAGLGMPLPAGSTALYAARGEQRLLIGLGTMRDRTTGETIRIAAGTSTQVTVVQEVLAGRHARLTVRNANPFPVTLDLPIGAAGQRVQTDDPAAALADGVLTWSPVLPPNAERTLDYRF
ncbi:hypothetical protein LK533_01060 [Sphingomonas sp. PL-96]|uniref:DUF4139 domain-containing protein n=1 Tax=Sphingomonas sp. PL-96 TaxID=2887201 RepID=UPI001E47A1C2|nr:hypothetical protein [Sphingomonas sp. PL-96]MCC2975261.1 hypothetical protein [Sphingomonas sp. PL-96]